MGIDAYRQRGDDALRRLSNFWGKASVNDASGQMPAQVDNAVAGYLGDQGSQLGTDT